MEKQIDEMAKDLCRTDTCEIKKIGKPCNHRCKAHIYAARAIDKGYRKASDVAEEIIADLENGIDELLKVYTEVRNREFMTDNPTEYTSGKVDAYWSVKVRLAELKKKYTITEEK